MFGYRQIKRGWMDLLALQLRQNEWAEVPPRMFQSMSALLTHLAKAVELNRTFFLIKSAHSAMLDALDRFRVGVCIIARGGFVVARNKEADRILASADGIYISRANVVRASDDVSDSEVCDAVQKVCTTSAGDGHIRPCRQLS
jgi:hypothetical protein